MNKLEECLEEFGKSNEKFAAGILSVYRSDDNSLAKRLKLRTMILGQRSISNLFYLKVKSIIYDELNSISAAKAGAIRRAKWATKEEETQVARILLLPKEQRVAAAKEAKALIEKGPG